MNDHPYTTADEDPFNAHQQLHPPKHRRSSLLDKWILEQQYPTEYPHTLRSSKPRASDASPSFSNPYLAYPDLPRVTPIDTSTEKDDTTSIHSYDLVDDDDIPTNIIPENAVPQANIFFFSRSTRNKQHSIQDPPDPLPARSTRNLRRSINPSFRNINLHFRSPTPSNSQSSSSRAFPRLSIFQRTPRFSAGISSDDINTLYDHGRSPSILTHNRTISEQSANSNFNLHSPRVNSRWRPSVLGHFYQPSASQSSVLVSETPSRPSISSADTSTTSRTATTIESNALLTPPRLPLVDSIGSRNTLLKTGLKFPTASGSSIWLPGHGSDSSLRGTQCQILSPQRTTFTPEPNDDDGDIDLSPTFRTAHHDTIRPSIPYSSAGTLPRVKFSSLNTRSQRKKKKLVISGIGADETRKFEGIKRWCEVCSRLTCLLPQVLTAATSQSFGEVRQITRMPNGDLHIDFRDPEVADTVRHK